MDINTKYLIENASTINERSLSSGFADGPDLSAEAGHNFQLVFEIPAYLTIFPIFGPFCN